ncbi:two-CW domain-containing protein [Thermodesulfobacteriota bacterium]
MDSKEFKSFRLKMNKSQRQIAQMLGTSMKAIQSYEQGWRNIPNHAERQMLFLISKMKERHNTRKPCWVIKQCPRGVKNKCPAWEFNSGNLCWFINGTYCGGNVVEWEQKMQLCRSCEAFISLS